MKRNITTLFAKVQGALQRGTVATLCLIIAAGCISCVKQKNCDCGETGTFIYFKEPQEIIYCGYPKKIDAIFSSDKNCFPIKGTIPKAFQVQDTIKVRVCVKPTDKRNICLTYGFGKIYSLKCIEREEK